MLVGISTNYNICRNANNSQKKYFSWIEFFCEAKWKTFLNIVKYSVFQKKESSKWINYSADMCESHQDTRVNTIQGHKGWFISFHEEVKWEDYCHMWWIFLFEVLMRIFAHQDLFLVWYDLQTDEMQFYYCPHVVMMMERICIRFHSLCGKSPSWWMDGELVGKWMNGWMVGNWMDDGWWVDMWMDDWWVGGWLMTGW